MRRLINRRYQIVRLLGKGGMGSVYLARDLLRASELVALKFIHPAALRTNHLAQFKQEFAALRQLRHPNLIQVFDLETDAKTGEPFFTMEFVAGDDLPGLIRQRMPATRRSGNYLWLFDIIAQTCRALQFLHAHGLIHHDVKPANIRVTLDGRVKLMDFGLIGEPGGDGGLHLRGTPAYIAPEAIRGDPVDHRADLYSLGVTLYELFTGRLPFNAETSVAILRQHTEETPPRPSQLSADLPEGFEGLILRLLAKEPAQRFAHAGLVIAALNELVSGLNAPLETVDSYHSYIQSPKMVGREEELTRIFGQLLRANQGSGRLLFLAGPMGIGKTRLAREVKLQAQLRRVLVIETVCLSRGQSPLHAWVPVFEQLLAYRNAARLKTAPGDIANLQQWLPSLAGPVGENTPPAAAYAPLAAAYAPPAAAYAPPELLFETAARIATLGRPILFILDDLHNADSETISLLSYLSQFAPHAPWLFCGLYRDDELDETHPLNRLIEGAERAPRSGETTPAEAPSDPEIPLLVTLDPLSERATADFLQAVLGYPGSQRAETGVLSSLASQLMSATGGNPLFIELILHDLVDQNLLRLDGDAWQVDFNRLQNLPGSIHALARKKLARLSEAHLGFFQWASAHGDWLDFALLAAVTGLADEAIYHFVQGGVREKILASAPRAGDGQAYRFTSDPMRWVCYETIRQEERPRYHEAIARALGSLSAGMESRELQAWHWERAGNPAQAFTHLIAAADQARSLLAHQSASQLYSRAVALADSYPGLAGLPALFELYSNREACNEMLANRPAQRADLDAMERIASQLGEPGRQIRALLRRARLEIGMGNHLLARQYAERAGELAQIIADRNATAESLTVVGEASYWLDDFLRTKESCATALPIFQELGDIKGEARVSWLLGIVARREENLTLTKEYFTQSLALYRRAGDREGEIDALNGLGVIETNFAYKRDYYEQTLALAEALGDRSRTARTYNNLGLLYANLGLYRRAREYLESAVKADRENQSRWSLVYSLESLGRVYIELEEVDLAQGALTEGLALSSQLGSRQNEALFYLALGKLALLKQDFSSARRNFTEALAIQDELHLSQYQAITLSWLGQCCLQAGDWLAAEQATASALGHLARARSTGSFPQQEIWWRRYQVLTHSPVQSPDEATRLDAEARRCLQRAHDEMLSSIATLSDEGLRRNYFNRVRVNREILSEWASRFPARAAEQELEERSPSPQEALPATDLARLRAQLYRVLELTSKMTEARDVQGLLDFVMDQVIELSGAERGFVILFDDRGLMDIRVARGMSRGEAENMRKQMSQTVLGEVTRTRRAVLLQDALADERFGRQSSVLDLQIRSVVCAPLLLHAELIGVIYADNRSISGRFSQADLDLLTIFANQAAAALENARLHEATLQANQSLEKAAQTLERRVDERTKELEKRSHQLQTVNVSLTRRAVQLETSSKVAAHVASILDLDRLLEEVVHLIQSQFGYYFVGVWMLDSDDNSIKLMAGYPQALWNLPTRLQMQEETTITFVCNTGQPRYVARKRDTAHLYPGKLPYTRSELSLPLIFGKRAIGVLDIHSRQEAGFDEDDQMLLQALANQIAIAIRNVQLYQSEQERRKMAEALERSGRATSSSLDLRAVPQVILEQLASVIPYERGAIWSHQKNKLVLMAHIGFPKDPRLEKMTMPVRRGDVFQQIVKKRLPVLIGDTSQESGWLQVDWLPFDRSWLGVPLIARDRVIGMLSLTRKDVDAFTPADAARTWAFAAQAAIALENAILYDRIMKFNENLERTVQERTDELNRAYQALQSLEKAKSNFIDVAAHELRTPLTTIHGYSHLLLENSAAAENDEIRMLAQGILRGATRLHEIVNSILDVAKIDSQSLQITREWTNLAMLVNQAHTDFNQALVERKISLTIAGVLELPAIKADAILLYKVIQNLFGNAIKFTPDGGAITITGRCIKDGDLEEVELVFADTGIGIALEEQAVVFEKFRHTGDIALHSSGRTKFKGGGPGLGLAIARGVVLAHGGRIWVESAGRDEAACPGSRFIVRLPIVK